MFQLLEIVGVSDSGFSEAVNDAIEKVTDVGEKVFWFEVLEQRGAMRKGSIQYQVKLKVAVALESAEKEEPMYICPSCGRTSDTPEVLCHSRKL